MLGLDGELHTSDDILNRAKEIVSEIASDIQFFSIEEQISHLDEYVEKLQEQDQELQIQIKQAKSTGKPSTSESQRVINLNNERRLNKTLRERLQDFKNRLEKEAHNLLNRAADIIDNVDKPVAPLTDPATKHAPLTTSSEVLRFHDDTTYNSTELYRLTKKDRFSAGSIRRHVRDRREKLGFPKPPYHVPALDGLAFKNETSPDESPQALAKKWRWAVVEDPGPKAIFGRGHSILLQRIAVDESDSQQE